MAAVLLVCAVLFFSVLAMHAPLIAARSMRHVSSSAKMLPQTHRTDLAVAPLMRAVEPVMAFLPLPLPRRMEHESPPLPEAPVLGPASLRAPPLA